MKVELLPLDRVLVDPDFNCRTSITVSSIQDLIDTIKDQGLIEPIIVQTADCGYWSHPDFDYRTLAGSRRTTACKVLKHTVIPGIIRNDLSLAQAQKMNLTENLQRKNINILEQAIALSKIFDESVSARQAARELRVDVKWIRMRRWLIKAPEEIQQQTAAGLLSLTDIEHLTMLPEERWVEAAKSFIASKRETGTRRRVPKELKPFKRRKKNNTQIKQMIREMMNRDISGLPVRALAWVTGEGDITDAQLKKEIRNATANTK